MDKFFTGQLCFFAVGNKTCFVSFYCSSTIWCLQRIVFHFFYMHNYPELQGSIVICSGIANVHCRILIEKDDEIGKLRNSLIEISEEVSKMHGSLTTLEKSPTASKEDRTSRELDTHETRAVISKLQHVHTSIQQYKRYMQLQITKKQQNSYFFTYT